ncbi:transposase [Weissella confusa]|uniref:transposase n=5 Tax=Weissella confusa TaxID=1583 RepID=UPI001C6FD04F|nr:transposase [Weissella confusa]UYY89900.1 transposase [Weissella confusa]UYY89908.1 transposase [Weissella confusa]UYY91195.1 transposase [Weissella confusa]
MIRYSPEFKQSLVEMHNQGRSYTELAAEYGPSADSIRNWVKLYTVHEVGGEKWTQADVNALQKENAKLREELEILKRAAVLLSKYN